MWRALYPVAGRSTTGLSTASPWPSGQDRCRPSAVREDDVMTLHRDLGEVAEARWTRCTTTGVRSGTCGRLAVPLDLRATPGTRVVDGVRAGQEVGDEHRRRDLDRSGAPRRRRPGGSARTPVAAPPGGPGLARPRRRRRPSPRCRGRTRGCPWTRPTSLVTVGGDGTLLHALHALVAAGRDVPVFGVHRGTTGFLLNAWRGDDEDLHARIAASSPERITPLSLVDDGSGRRARVRAARLQRGRAAPHVGAERPAAPAGRRGGAAAAARRGRAHRRDGRRARPPTTARPAAPWCR